MEKLLEKVKVQVDRGTVNLPEDRKTLQEFGKIWKKVYEALKKSPDEVPKYKNIIKKIANSAKTGTIDKLAGRFTFMGKMFDVEVDKSKWSEYSPTPWKIGFVGNIGESIVNESLICELPHGDYDEKGIDGIDFRIEKMPIPQDQKKELTKNFLSGKGIIGQLPKSKKLMLFTPDGIKVLKGQPKDKSMILPKDWSKYALILKDHLGEITMKKSELKEMIRKVVREVLMEKWEGDVDVKSTGQHADKTIGQLKKQVAALKAKKTSTEADKKLMGQLLFAIRAKQGWKKGEGATGL